MVKTIRVHSTRQNKQILYRKSAQQSIFSVKNTGSITSVRNRIPLITLTTIDIFKRNFQLTYLVLFEMLHCKKNSVKKWKVYIVKKQYLSFPSEHDFH